jgi:Family of unknown function (DUF5990)
MGAIEVCRSAALGGHVEQMAPIPTAEDVVRDKGQPVFTGTFAHGPPAGRFLYLSWKLVAAHELRRLRIFGQRDRLKADRSKKGREKWA